MGDIADVNLHEDAETAAGFFVDDDTGFNARVFVVILGERDFECPRSLRVIVEVERIRGVILLQARHILFAFSGGCHLHRIGLPVVAFALPDEGVGDINDVLQTLRLVRFGGAFRRIKGILAGVENRVAGIKEFFQKRTVRFGIAGRINRRRRDTGKEQRVSAAFGMFFYPLRESINIPRVKHLEVLSIKDFDERVDFLLRAFRVFACPRM